MSHGLNPDDYTIEQAYNIYKYDYKMRNNCEWLRSS